MIAAVRRRAAVPELERSISFQLPAALEAREPPEIRGRGRDDVRLMVASRSEGHIEHARFAELPDHLRAGDLLVVNVSSTLPAATTAVRADGSEVRLHVSTRPRGLGSRWRTAELRSADGSRPERGAIGQRLTLAAGGGSLELVAPYAGSRRLWLTRHDGESSFDEHLWRSGEPITYGHLRRHWPLATYQNVYASVPGSSEMASAGRPFTAELITRLVSRGVQIAPIVLHCGVSSLKRDEPPFPEQYAVPDQTARLVAATRAWHGRVIAVGTSVVRALESAARPRSGIQARAGWADLVIGPDQELRAVDGLITGWHEPEASHLLLLEAVAGIDLLARSYRDALDVGYLWHEFGDSHIILP